MHAMNAMNTSVVLTTEHLFYKIKPTMNASPPRLYRQHFTPAECALLDRFREDDGASELAMLRLLLARTAAVSGASPRRGWVARAAALSVYCRTALNLAELIRCQVQLAKFRPDPLLESIAARDLEDL